VLKITSKKDGFRRCGVEHPATPTLHKDDAFTDEQIKILKAEPMLIVDEVEDKPKGKSENLTPNDDEKKASEEKKATEEKKADEKK
jgi:hypothetical protein